MVQPPKELPPLPISREGTMAEPGTNTSSSISIKPPIPPLSQSSQAQQPIMQQRSALNESKNYQQPLSPQTITIQTTPSQPKPAKELVLPRIEPPIPRDKTSSQKSPVHEEELRRFEEAINKINIDIIHTEPSSRGQEKTRRDSHEKISDQEEEYYHPGTLGEGYFSEIEHYIKHKDVNEIIDDLLSKDFLNSMKDYHESKAQGKAFYLHKQDLKNKLEKKMEALRCLEEEWHELKIRIEEEEKKKREIEQRIEQESQDLKELFKQVRHNQWLEQEAPEDQVFKLKGGLELKSLNELRKALSFMSDEEFNHHVNAERNDFANWARDVLKNNELAEKIAKARSKEELQAVLQSPI